ncbi:MAG: DUF3035 domain-containing protein [bacterium]|nr:DUF3035 domain-containing protein [bacterium]MDY2829995.1 DUF3035 domain-containing protein [Alphaproteobacteria bacterium]
MRVVLTMICMLGLLSACGLTKEKLGLSRPSPDETQVEQRAPLSLPPEFDVRPEVSHSAVE